MEPPPFVSVIIPAYNSAWCIVAALRSVLAQTFSDFEIIVVDDGSQDGTWERVAALADRRIKYYRQERSERSTTRNRAIELATGEWVAFLDADDLWLPEKLEKQVAAVQQYPQVVLVYSQSYSFSERNRETGEAQGFQTKTILGSGRTYPSDCLREFLLARFPVRTSTVMARRSTLLEIGGFDPQFTNGEDWDVFIRLAQHGPVLYVEEPLAVYWLGSYRTHLERGLQYDWHHALLRVAEKNLQVTGLAKKDPSFANRVLATWEWRCALVERGLGRLESARAHARRTIDCQENFLDRKEMVEETIYILLDDLGEQAVSDQLTEELKAVLADLLPAHNHRSFYHRCLGQIHAIEAFRAYQTFPHSRGLYHTILAIYHDPTWLRNRGLWSLTLRRLMRQTGKGRSSQE